MYIFSDIYCYILYLHLFFIRVLEIIIIKNFTNYTLVLFKFLLIFQYVFYRILCMFKILNKKYILLYFHLTD